MSESNSEYKVENCHEHSLNADDDVPFWRRAAITEAQLATLRRELVQAKTDLAAAAAQYRWIAVTEKYPPEWVPVLVYSESRAYFGAYRDSWSGSKWGFGGGMIATHWMFLPIPPESEVEK